MKKICIIISIVFLIFPVITSAHSGRTDSTGGHYDYSTGEYHYHHGYSAHQHINGLCPYDADLEYLLPDKCPKCGDTINAENGSYCFQCGYELAPLSGIRLLPVSGSPNKTRSEYFNEVEELENKISKLESKITSKQNTIGSLTQQYEEDIEKMKYEQLTWHTIYIIIILILIYFICKLKNNTSQ